MALGPLALISGNYARKKTKNLPKWIAILALLLISCTAITTMGMAINNCVEQFFKSLAPDTPAATSTPSPAPAPSSTPTAPAPVTETPTEPIPCPNCSTPTPNSQLATTQPSFMGNWDAYPMAKESINVAVQWIKDYLGYKADHLLASVVFKLREDADGGMSTEFPNKAINVWADEHINDSDWKRTEAIHEMGHIVDYDAGIIYFGSTGVPGKDYWSAHQGFWVDEWKRDDQRNAVLFTGNFEDLPSDYLLSSANPDFEGKYCVYSRPAPNPVELCKAEDFAETFTYMVYKSRGLRLETIRTWNQYQLPSKARRDFVEEAISFLP